MKLLEGAVLNWSKQARPTVLMIRIPVQKIQVVNNHSNHLKDHDDNKRNQLLQDYKMSVFGIYVYCVTVILRKRG